MAKSSWRGCDFQMYNTSDILMYEVWSRRSEVAGNVVVLSQTELKQVIMCDVSGVTRQ
jgi:hypothetical protein